MTLAGMTNQAFLRQPLADFSRVASSRDNFHLGRFHRPVASIIRRLEGLAGPYRPSGGFPQIWIRSQASSDHSSRQVATMTRHFRQIEFSPPASLQPCLNWRGDRRCSLGRGAPVKTPREAGDPASALLPFPVAMLIALFLQGPVGG